MDTGDTIRIWLKTTKAKFKQKLGDPNHREKWLEGLAMAQAVETGETQPRDSNTSCILKSSNFTPSKSATSTKWQGCPVACCQSALHTQMVLLLITHKKNSMEAACLEEARAHFTQANDTPFLTSLLVEELGLLNCNDKHFKVIANGQYQTPAGTALGAQLLLQHLKQPPEVPDCDLMLTETTHSDGWQKAKERITSSLSGAHFGHYKAGTYSKLINAVHMALLAIPLRMGFSYN